MIWGAPSIAVARRPFLAHLFEIHTLSGTVCSGDERHAATVGDVGVIRDEVVHRELLLEVIKTFST